LIQIVSKLRGTHYLSGPAAKSYMDEAAFLDSGIAVRWADYGQSRPYPQLHGEFDDAVSMLDLMMMVGKESSNFLLF